MLLLLLQLQLHLLLLSLSSFCPLHLQGLFLERARQKATAMRVVLLFFCFFFAFIVVVVVVVAAAFLVCFIYRDKFFAVSDVKNNERTAAPLT